MRQFRGPIQKHWAYLLCHLAWSLMTIEANFNEALICEEETGQDYIDATKCFRRFHNI